MSDLPKSDYDEYPKTLARDDFWGQVRRTIDGRRIGEDDVRQIVDAIRTALALGPGDVLLDLACGNGALGSRLFDDCNGALGVDSSRYLIEIADDYFARPPAYTFLAADVVDYVRTEPRPERFTKALCYGSMMFLSTEQLAATLTELRRRFPAVQRLMLGNVPDRERAARFREDNPEIGSLDLDDPTAQAGRWWAQEDLTALALRCGWESTRVSRLSPDVFNARYRYDMTLVAAATTSAPI